LDEAGYTSTVATNSEFEIERYPRLGDVVSATAVYEDVSEEKKTALGTGFFLTWLTTYTNQHGEVLGRQRFRVLRFRPANSWRRDWRRQSARTPSSSGADCARTSS